MESVLELRSLNYSWTKIASIIDISRSTLYRKLAESGISTNDYSNLSPNQLDDIIKTIKKAHPTDGEVLMKGHLLSCGIRVKRVDMRESIHRVDHRNTVLRRSSTINRHIYSVPHPNYMCSNS